MQNNGYIWGIVIAAIVIIGAFFIFNTQKAAAPGPMASSTLSIASTSPQIGGTISTTSSEQVVATGSLRGAGGVTPPSLTGGIVIAPTVSFDQATTLRTNEQPLITQLKAAPTRVDLWLTLGLYRKEAGDYAGAIAAWNYVAVAGPDTVNFIAYGDLGDLYMNFDTNYPKAEASYLAAIKLKPSYIDYYRDLFTLYRSFYKTNTTAAADIVAQGLKANPNNPDLLDLQKQTKS